MNFSIRTKATLLIVVIIVLVSATSVIFFENTVKQIEEEEYTGRSIRLAETVALAIDVDQVSKLKDDVIGIYRTAENGQIAVDLFESHPEGYYSAVIMDMRMPVMDGLEATMTIRAMERPDAKTIPIIALTANAFNEDVQQSLQAGLNAHLSKPVNPDDLYETLENLIRD